MGPKLSFVSMVWFSSFVNREEVRRKIEQIRAWQGWNVPGRTGVLQATVRLQELEIADMLLGHPEVIRAAYEFSISWSVFVESRGCHGDAPEVVLKRVGSDNLSPELAEAWDVLERVATPYVQAWLVAANATKPERLQVAA
jgi:hypothetical protein